MIKLRHTNLRTQGTCISTTYMYTTPSAVCLSDNIGLVSLILLGWELHVSYVRISLYYVYKASRSCLLCFLCHPYIPHYNLKNFFYLYTQYYRTVSLGKYETETSCSLEICIIVGERGRCLSRPATSCQSLLWCARYHTVR